MELGRSYRFSSSSERFKNNRAGDFPLPGFLLYKIKYAALGLIAESHKK